MRNCTDNNSEDELSPELWERVRALFQQLVGQEQELIAVKLSLEDSPTVAVKVRQLLGFSDATSDFLERGIAELGLESQSARQRPSLSIGDTLCHRFRIISFIGAGGVGEVYEAGDKHLRGEKLALKILNPRGLSAFSAWSELSKEVQLARRVTHPNVCRVFDLAKHHRNNGSSFDLVTMELLKGDTLDEMISAVGCLEPDLALTLARQLAHGLDAAHSVGVLHRDLKPKNVIVSRRVTQSARAVITDFGLARDLLLSESASHESWTSGIFGTPAYMAPEQLYGRRADTTTDVYAFGLILFEMLTGSKPFRGRTGFEIAANRLKEEPLPLSRFRTGLLPAWQEAVSACLQPDPGQRPQQVAEVIDLLKSHPKASGLGSINSKGKRPIPTGKQGGEAASRMAAVKKVAVVGLVGLSLGLLAAIPKSPFGISRHPDTPGRSGGVLEGTLQADIRHNRVVVLPFENYSNSPKLEFVAEGLGIEATKALSRLEGLEVVSHRSGHLAWAKVQGDRLQAARQLEAGRYVYGSVDQFDGRIRVSIEVVDRETHAVEWSEAFEQPSEKIPLLIEAMSSSLAAELGRSMDSRGHPSPFPGTSDDFYLYLEAQHLFRSRQKKHLERALSLFDQVIGRNPEYAPALVGRANVLNSLAEQGFLPVQRARLNARRDAAEAVRQDGDYPEALASFGLQLAQDWDPGLAEQHFEKAIELSPNLAGAHHWFSNLLVRQGKLGEALEHGEKARRLDPLSISVNWSLGWLYFNDRQYARAIQMADRILELNPEFAQAFQLKAEAQVFSGDPLGALRNVSKALRLSDDAPIILSAAAYINILNDDIQKGTELLDRLLDLAAEKDIQSLLVANVYAALGRDEDVFQWLNRAADQRDSVILLVRYYPLYDRYRSDPRYKRFLDRFDVSS